MSLYQGSFRKILFVASCVSLIGLLILVLLTTDPIQDLTFFATQVQFDSIVIDAVVILFGVLGFLYFFILPGLPFLLLTNGAWISREPRILLTVTMYSGAGNYAILLLGMTIGFPILSVFAPLLLLLLAIGLGFLSDEARISDECVYQSPIKLLRTRGRLSYITIAGILVIIFSLVIRFIIFNSNLVEFSDVIDYHQQISSIASNNFLINPDFAARAPLYAMYGFLFSYITPTLLSSLKVISFMFGLLMFVPALSIMMTLSKNTDSSFIHVVFPVLFAIYPWTMIMAAVALQDILLAFYVMAFVALLIGKTEKEVIAGAVAAGLAFLCRYSAGVLGPIGFFYLLIRFRMEGIRKTFTFAIVWSVISGSWIVRNLVVAGVPFSTTDEGLFSLSNFIPGIINVVKELGMDRHGMNTIALWIPIILAIIFVIRTDSGRKKIKEFFTLDYLLVYFTLLGQILIVSLFFAQQYRFMLSIIWVFPIIWILLVDSLEIPGKHLLSAGWVIFSIAHALNITRIYWVFDMGRAPPGRFPGPDELIPAVMPTIGNIGFSLIVIAVLITSVVFIYSEILPRFSKSVEI